MTKTRVHMRLARRQGMALVIVLSILTLTTLIVLAYLVASQLDLATSNAYWRSQLAEEIGRGAVEELVEQLRRESREASSNPGDQFGLSPVRVGVTETNARMSALVRRSVSLADGAFAAPFSAGGVTSVPGNFASALSSTNASPDGRHFSMERWRAPQLIASNIAMVAPDWIFLTREGPAQVSDADVSTLREVEDPSNLKAVIGRYAYAIYDLSGLFHANIAGTPGNDVRQGQKGASALASLLPVFSAAGGDEAGLNAFFQWRQPASSLIFEDIYGVDPSPGSPGRSGHLETGFRQANTNNNLFFSRQELLKYARDNASTFPKGALPYFTTFAKSVNAPEIDEAMPARSGYLENTARRDISYHDADGVVQTYEIKAGDPFLQRKFPLSRLRWFEHCEVSGKPQEPYATAIKKHFGLTWVDDLGSISAPEYSGVAGYVYTSPDGSTAVSSIKTLDQVMAQGREPDFFEWLKAAIDTTSLGVSGGAAHTTVAATQDNKPDFQIIQIGANIIDQADSNDVPTNIATLTATNRNGTALIAFGVESLPYINEVMASFHRPAGAVDQFHGYLNFEMWNPHQNAARQPKDYVGTTLSGPNFRVRVVEGRPWIYPRLRIDGVNGSLMSTVEAAAHQRRTIQPKTFSGDLTNDTVTFSYQEQDFSEPRLLGDDSSNDYVITGQNGRVVRLGPPPGTAGFKGVDAGYSSAPNPVFPAGMRFAAASSIPADLIDPLTPGFTYPIGEKYYNAGAFTCLSSGVANPPSSPPQPITMVAEMQLSDGRWVPYQTIESWGGGFSSELNITREYPSTAKASVDPRHFGAGGTSPALNWEPNAWKGNSSTDWKQWNWSNPGQGGPQQAYSQILTGNVTGRAYTGWADFNAHNSGIKMDPRTRRFGLPVAIRRSATGLSLQEAAAATGDVVTGSWPGSGMAGWTGASGSPSSIDLARNLTGSAYNYADASGKVRPADWAYLTGANTPSLPGVIAGRPVILNRPFRSLAELGYVFRDLPWKTLDFFSPVSAGSPLSADLKLLDVFCIEDGPEARGRINPNTAPAPILEALMQGSANNSASFALGGGQVTNASSLAVALTNSISGTNSVRRTSDLVRQLMQDTTYTAIPSKISREAYARGLIGATDSRTWNLLIDVVAQSGRFPRATTRLSDFRPTGECRYWVQVAIDRVTGRIVDMVLEPVYE